MEQAKRYCEQAQVTDNIVSSGAEGGPVISRKKKARKVPPRVQAVNSPFQVRVKITLTFHIQVNYQISTLVLDIYSTIIPFTLLEFTSTGGNEHRSDVGDELSSNATHNDSQQADGK